MNYGIKMKELREKENVTQQSIADYMGISRTSYKQFENQYDIIPIKRLNQFCNFFDISIDYVFSLSNDLSYNVINRDISLDISSKRLKEFRKENNFTQQKLADSLNISRSVILYHENKRTVLGTPFLYSLCKKYQISADYLLGKTDSPKYLK